MLSSFVRSCCYYCCCWFISTEERKSTVVDWLTVGVFFLLTLLPPSCCFPFSAPVAVLLLLLYFHCRRFPHYDRCVLLSRFLAVFPLVLPVSGLSLPTSTKVRDEESVPRVWGLPARDSGWHGFGFSTNAIPPHTRNLANTFRWHSGKTFNHCTSTMLCLHLAEL